MWSVIDYLFGVSDDARVEARVEEINAELEWRRFYVATVCYLLGFFLLAFNRLMKWTVDEPREDEEARRLTRQEMDKEWEDLRKRVKRRQDRLIELDKALKERFRVAVFYSEEVEAREDGEDVEDDEAGACRVHFTSSDE